MAKSFINWIELLKYNFLLCTAFEILPMRGQYFVVLSPLASSPVRLKKRTHSFFLITQNPPTLFTFSEKHEDLDNTGFSIWKSWIQPSVLETFYDILKLSLVLTHSVGWALLLLGKKFDIPAQFDSKEWVFWSLLFLQNLRFDWFSVFLKNSFLLQMRINDQIQT